MFRRMFGLVTCLVVLWVGCLIGAEPSIDHEAYQKALSALKTKSQVPITQEEIESVLSEQLSNADVDAISNESGTTEQYKEALEAVLGYLNQQLNVDSPPQRLPYRLTSDEENPFFSKSVVGVGMKLDHIADSQDPSPPTIIELLESTRFEGLEVGDEIVKVDDIDALKLREEGGLIDAIRGDVGTQVTLTVKRAERTFGITITRRPVSFSSAVLGNVIDGIGVIRLNDFSSDSVIDELGTVLNHLISCGIRGIVLDLRNTPGGPLKRAVHCARFFSHTSDLLCRSRFALSGVTCGVTEITTAQEVGKAADLPLAIVVNEKTTGAAEALAATFQNQGHLVVGTQTRGYGRLFSTESVGRGYTLFYYHGNVALPSDHLLEGTGVTPDVETPDENEALHTAVEILKK